MAAYSITVNTHTLKDSVGNDTGIHPVFVFEAESEDEARALYAELPYVDHTPEVIASLEVRKEEP